MKRYQSKTAEDNEKYAKAMEAVLQYSPGGIFSYSAEADEQFSYISDNMLLFLGYSKKNLKRNSKIVFLSWYYEEEREN